MVYKWLENILDALLPARCPLCGEKVSGGGFCPGCLADLPWIGHACRRCGLPLPATAGAFCGRCLNQSPAFDRTLAPLAWRAPVDRLVHALKFREGLHLVGPLAGLWQPAERPEALIPVPLHPARLRERGFNQADLLARAAGSRLGIPVLSPCRRRRATPPQHRLDARARRRNLAGAFACTGLPGHLRHVALVDDVMTTGSTLEALARALRARDGLRVDAWVLARVE